MQIRKFEVQNIPHAFVESDRYSWSQSSDDSESIPSTQSPGYWGHSPGGNRQNSRRRRKGRKAEMKTHKSPPHDKPMTKNDIYFALDCEMVGVGPEGLESALARVTICSWDEKVVFDTFVKVPTEVTDYRTFVSGIEAKDLEGDGAMPLKKVRQEVKKILHGKILIGHALENDLAALQLTHPWHDIRDSAQYPKFMRELRDADSDRSLLRPRKLKELAKDLLGEEIQVEGKAHNPVEDARAALNLYKAERMEWEKWVMKQVASAREKEMREGESSPRENSYPRYDPPSPTESLPQSNFYGNSNHYHPNPVQIDMRYCYGYGNNAYRMNNGRNLYIN